MNANKFFPIVVIIAIIGAMATAGILGLKFWHCLLETDNELYFYGRNRFNKYPPLVADARPVTCYNDRFYGVDKLGTDGFSIVSFESDYTYIIDNERFWMQYNIYHDSICSYGYNDSVIVVELVSPKGDRYYIYDNYANSQKTIRINADTCTILNPLDYFGLTKWIDNVNNPPSELIRSVAHWTLLLRAILFFELVCVVILILLIIKWRKNFLSNS